jgi:hypothetical protein
VQQQIPCGDDRENSKGRNEKQVLRCAQDDKVCVGNFVDEMIGEMLGVE